MFVLLIILPYYPVDVEQHPVELLAAAAEVQLTGHDVLELVLVVAEVHFLGTVDV